MSDISVDPNLTPESALLVVNKIMARVKDEADKNKDPETVSYYSGAIDILEEIHAVFSV